jgi:hypothetical protein
MACTSADAPCPGCPRSKTACGRDILQDLFDDLMAGTSAIPATRRPAPAPAPSATPRPA